MATNIIGVRNNNVIVPYSAATKRTKEIDITVTSAQAGWSTVRARAIFYADSSGNWRMRFNISGTFTSTSISSIAITVSNVTFKNTASFRQAVAGFLSGATGLACVAEPNGGTINCFPVGSPTCSAFEASGDVELESEPTTYTTAANMEGVTAVDVYIAPASASAAGLLSYYEEGTWTPIVTLVGGSGNTVPQYSTNIGRYTRINNRVFCDITLSGDGGNEGAGSGSYKISIPFTSKSSAINAYGTGYGNNGSTDYQLMPVVEAGGVSAVTITYWSAGSVNILTGAGQNNTARGVRVSFNYEI